MKNISLTVKLVLNFSFKQKSSKDSEDHSMYLKNRNNSSTDIIPRYCSRISLMTVGDEELKSSPIPFAIPVNL